MTSAPDDAMATLLGMYFTRPPRTPVTDRIRKIHPSTKIAVMACWYVSCRDGSNTEGSRWRHGWGVILKKKLFTSR